MKPISGREFTLCPLYDTDIPKEHCGSCEYNIVTASRGNKCGFCKLSARDYKIGKLSERDDIIKQYMDEDVIDDY